METRRFPSLDWLEGHLGHLLQGVTSALRRRPALFLILAAALFGLTNLLLGEVVPVRDGFGWDGVAYKEIAQDPGGLLLGKRFRGFLVGRSLPSLVIHAALRVLALPLSDANVLRAFQVGNLLLFVATCYLWWRVADRLALGTAGRWLAFSGVFLNVATLKLYFYLPVLTDQTALFLSVLLLYCFLSDRPAGMLAATALAAFSWPLVVYYGMLLYVFPRQGGDPKRAGTKALSTFVALAIAGAVLAALATIYVVIVVLHKAPYEAHRISTPSVYLSIAAGAAYVFLLFRRFLDESNLLDVRRLWRQIRWERAVVAAAFVIFYVMVTHALGGPASRQDLIHVQLKQILLYSIRQPGLSPVSHLVYFGPILFLAALCWRGIGELVGRLGAGAALFMAAGLCLSVDPESRHVLFFSPLLVALTAKAAERLQWRLSSYLGFAGLCLLCSKVWLQWNTLPWTEDAPKREFPAQYLFMNLGPWMSTSMYLVQGAVAVALGAVGFLLMRQARAAGPGSSSGQLVAPMEGALASKGSQ